MSDFGTKDGYVGSVKGVLLKNAPQAAIIDITHEIPPFDIKSAAYTLLNYYDSFPANTVHLIVVDPGVGGERKPVILKTMQYYFVGPENGVFDFILKREAYQAYEIKPELVNPEVPGFTFHGRDVFAPAAAMLAKGIAPQEIALPIDRLNIYERQILERKENICLARIVSIDHFGNIIFGLSKEDLKHWKKSVKSVSFKNFKFNEISAYYAQKAAGEPLVLWNSKNMLEIAVREGSAAEFFKADLKENKAVVELEDA